MPSSSTTRPERWARTHRRALLVTSAALLGSLVVLYEAARRGPLPGEQRLNFDIQRAAMQPNVIPIWDFVERVPAPAVAVITVVSAIAIALRRAGPRSALLLLAAAGIVVVNAGAKQVLGTTAAFHEITGRFEVNYPSGHVSYTTAFFGAIAWLGWSRRAPDVSVISLGLLLAIGPAVISRGSHVPSDVLGGYLLGGAWLLACVAATSGGAGRSA